MRALLHDFPKVEHVDAIGMAHGAQAVGDDKGRAVHHQAFQGLLNEALGLRVHAGRGFV